MKTTIRAAALLAVSFTFLTTTVQATGMHSIEARIGLGTSPDSQGFPGFFAGFGGGTSHTNSFTFSDGVVDFKIDMTVEGLDSSDQPANLVVNNLSAGIEIGVGDMLIDSGEKIKITYDNLSFSTTGTPPAMGIVDLSSFGAILSTVRLSAFGAGDDYAYSGVGSVVDTLQIGNTLQLELNTPIVTGDMLTITATAGGFRALFLSQSGNYNTIVPEPATFGLMAISLFSLAAFRRKR